MQHASFHYRLLIALSMFYMMAVITSDLLTYKIFQLASIQGSASLLIFPVIYLISDMITELYGKKLATYLLFCSLLMELIFDVIFSQIIYLPSPNNFQLQAAYEQVLGPLPRIYWGLIIALTVSALINITLMSWWKQKLIQRYYLLRSFCSTLIGVFFFTLIGYSIWFYDTLPIDSIINLILVSFGSKIIITAIMIWPSSLIVKKVQARHP